MPNRITLLYVDDEDINLFLFEKSFSSLYNVITANSGEEGLMKLANYSNDIIVVITDMRMPGMDGIMFIRKAKETFNNIAYYVLTAFNYNDEINKALLISSL
jgi:CheY-like chemotaxis protein